MSTSAQNGEFALALQYAAYADGYPLSVRAVGTATWTANNSDGDTLVVGGVTFVAKTSPSAATHVLIGASKEATAANFAAAIAAKQSVLGTAYHAATPPALKVTVEYTPGSNVVFFVAAVKGVAGNSVTLSQTGGHITVSGADLAGAFHGGTLEQAIARAGFKANPLDTEVIVIHSITYTFLAAPAISHDIQIGADLPTTLATLVADINLDTAVIASANEGVLELVAAAGGTAGNSFNLTTTSTVVSLSGSTFAGGQNLTPFDRATLHWKRMRVTDLDYDVTQIQSTISPEIGKVVTPTGAYKSAVLLSGGVTMMPRVEDSIGYLLLGALGKVTTTVPTTGVGQHVFTFDPADETYQPWLSVRKAIPPHEQFEGRGIVGYDNKVASLRLTVNAAQPVEARVEFEGRIPENDLHPEIWSGSNFEDFTTGLLGCSGTFAMPTIPEFPVPLSVTQAVLELGNMVTGPREELVIGSPYLNSIITKLRSFSIRFTYLWRDGAVWDRLFGGQPKAINWDPTPFRTLTAGPNYAFLLDVESAATIPGTVTKYGLKIRGNDVYWEMGNPTRLRGGDIVMMDVRGTILAPTSGSYVEFVLTNGNTTGYAIPSEP